MLQNRFQLGNFQNIAWIMWFQHQTTVQLMTRYQMHSSILIISVKCVRKTSSWTAAPTSSRRIVLPTVDYHFADSVDSCLKAPLARRRKMIL